MLRLIVTRVLYVVPVLFLVSLATFFMMELVPGDPAIAILGPDASPAAYERIRTELGLDLPVVQRYLDWLGGIVRFDFGQSLLPPIQNVSDIIQRRLPVTLQIAALAILMSLLMAIPAALYAAYRAGHRFDRAANSFAFASIAMPNFLVALILVFFFVFNSHMVRWTLGALGLTLTVWLVYRAVKTAREYDPGDGRGRQLAIGLAGAAVVAILTVLLISNFPQWPRQGFSRLTSGAGLLNNLRHAFLPAFALAIAEAAIFLRLLRSDLITTLQEDFILSAKAKGMPIRRILIVDALRPSSFSLITVAGVSLGRLIGGTVIVETIFNLPGMGRMIVDGVGAGDFRVVQAGVLVIAVFYVFINTMVDISYAYLDPRVRRGRA